MINDIMQRYLDVIVSGFGFIGGDVHWVFNALIVINIALAAMFWAFSNDSAIVPLLHKVIYVGMFAWIIENWKTLTDALARSFMMLGIKAGGGELSQDIFRNPALIAERGVDTIKPN